MQGKAGARARAWAAALLAGVLLAAPAAEAQSVKKLPPRHRDWLEKDVLYIITQEERDTFLRLPRDEDRDKFVEQFWLARDPTPGTPQNEYKDEHYRRIQHANAFFGSEWSEGWRSDRGKIYIILGPPGSRQFHVSGGQIYPMELWFYTSNEPALPPFFYVLFYQPFGMGDFRLYSPYIDGPEKLVRAAGVENRRDNAYRFLRDYNVELARASLSLIPSEPADINQPTSLSSDGMLMKIINLANDKFHKEKLDLNRRLREEVTARLTYEVPGLKLTVLPLRTAAGEDFLHYALQVLAPQDYALARYQDKYYLSVETQVRILDAKKKLIYETTREASAYYTDEQVDDVRTRPLSFEDRVPIAAGSYELEFTMLNRVNRSYHRATASVRVEPPTVQALALGRPILVQRCEPAQSPDEAFAFGSSRCTPHAGHEVSLGPNPTLNLLFGVYLDPQSLLGSQDDLKVQYTVGRLDRTLDSRTTEDKLDRKRFDRFGSLIVGKSVPLGELPPGAYIVSIQVTDTASGRTTGTTVPFRLAPNVLPTPNVLSPELKLDDEREGNFDFWRGLCSLAQNVPDEAATLFRRALERNPKHAGARARLAALHYSRGEYDKVAELLEAGGISSSTDLETVKRLVESLEKTGKLRRAIETAEQALALLEPTVELYEELASLYDKAGENTRANQAREEARKLAVKTNKK